MHISHPDGRLAFLDALTAFTGATESLDDGQLVAASRCRGWSVVDVAVHVHLGLQEMLLGVVSPTDATPDADAASYWRIALPTNDADADQVARIRFVRLLGAAYRRPTGAVRHLRATVDGLAGAVAALAPGAVRFQGRVLTTGDFLASWAVELAVHHLDLGREVTVPPPAPVALRLARETVTTLAGVPVPDSWTDETVVLLGAGRIAPDGDQRAAIGPDVLPVFG